MSEYLSKKAVLEWLKKQQKKQEENRDRLEIDHQYWEYHEGASDYLSLAVEEFESGAFDADTTEVQRLRAALERIAAVDVFDWSDETFQGCVDIAREALSTTSEPTVAERVRERYKNAEHLNATTSGATAEYYLGVMNGITDTLNDLGITIPGINAAKGDGNDA